MRTFTFGFDHKHPITGESLAHHYIQVPGEADLSRRFMHAVFGRNWAMQYKSPESLKYLDRMTELKWTHELLGLMSADDRDLFESVTGDRLEVHFGLEEKAKTSAEIDAYFDTMKDLPSVETITGTPIVEYGQQMAGGTFMLWHIDAETETIYPLGKRLFHAMRYGGEVYRRRVIVVEEWAKVDESDPAVQEALRKWTDHKVDLVGDATKKGPLLP